MDNWIRHFIRRSFCWLRLLNYKRSRRLYELWSYSTGTFQNTYCSVPTARNCFPTTVSTHGLSLRDSWKGSWRQAQPSADSTHELSRWENVLASLNKKLRRKISPIIIYLIISCLPTGLFAQKTDRKDSLHTEWSGYLKHMHTTIYQPLTNHLPTPYYLMASYKTGSI